MSEMRHRNSIKLGGLRANRRTAKVMRTQRGTLLMSRLEKHATGMGGLRKGAGVVKVDDERAVLMEGKRVVTS